MERRQTKRGAIGDGLRAIHTRIERHASPGTPWSVILIFALFGALFLFWSAGFIYVFVYMIKKGIVRPGGDIGSSPHHRDHDPPSRSDPPDRRSSDGSGGGGSSW